MMMPLYKRRLDELENNEIRGLGVTNRHVVVVDRVSRSDTRIVEGIGVSHSDTRIVKRINLELC